MLLVCVLLKVAVVIGMTYKTFTARGITLKSGQVIQTPTDWGPLPWPEGKIAIHHFSSDIVDKDGHSVPLAELYVHHWLMYNGDGIQNGGLCGGFLSNIFGAGAEIRGVRNDIPYPHALVSDGTESWTANLHFIRTSNVPQEYLQDCVECRCRSSNPPKFPHGGVECCPDGTMCWGMENSTIDDPKDYFFQYTLGWEPWTPEIIPIKVYSMDVTSHFNEDCLIEYNIPEVPEGKLNVRKNVIFIRSDWNVSFIETHQHAGGINMTIDHYRNGKFLNTMCSSSPVYSSPTGYIEDIPTCHFPEAYSLLQGDRLHMTSIYNGRHLAGGGRYHSGVMSLAFMAAHANPFPKEICLAELHDLCGKPPYKTLKECDGCVLKNIQDLVGKHNCTPLVIANECAKNTAGGNVPVPDAVHDMALIAIRYNTTHYKLNVTGPHDRWIAIGMKPGTGVMENAAGFVYFPDKSGKWRLQERILGMHAAGTIVNENLPVSDVSIVDNKITFTFETSILNFVKDRFTSPPPPGECFLFAHGAEGVTDFGYHGSFRGATCINI